MPYFKWSPQIKFLPHLNLMKFWPHIHEIISSSHEKIASPHDIFASSNEILSSTNEPPPPNTLLPYLLRKLPHPIKIFGWGRNVMGCENFLGEEATIL